jgi:hypothetical protein
MPKDTAIRRIDIPPVTGSSHRVINVRGSLVVDDHIDYDHITNTVTKGTLGGYRDVEVIGAYAYLMVGIGVDDTEIIVSAPLYHTGTHIELQHWEHDHERLIVTGELGQSAGGYRLSVQRAQHGTQAQSWPRYLTQVVNVGTETGGGFLRTTAGMDVNKPKMDVFSIENGADTWRASLGDMASLEQSFKDAFASVDPDFDSYGLATENVFIKGRGIMEDSETLNLAGFRGKLEARPYGELGGFEAGDTVQGLGQITRNHAGRPIFTSVIRADNKHIWNLDSGYGERIMRYVEADAPDAWQLDIGTLQIRENENGLILDAPLTGERLLKVLPSVTLPDGRHYAEIQVGDMIQQASTQSETFTGDITLVENVASNAVELHTAYNFPAGTLIEYSVYLTEDAGNEAVFTIGLDIAGTVVDSRELKVDGSAASLVGRFRSKSDINQATDIKVVVSYAGATSTAASKASLVPNTLTLSYSP